MEMNSYQKMCINGDSACCIATAGSGKSTVLVEKVNYVVENNIVDAKKVLCITFTKNAETHLSMKLNNRNKNLASVNVKTIHATALDVLRRNGYTLLTSMYGKKNFTTGKTESYGYVTIMQDILHKYYADCIKEKANMAEIMLKYADLRFACMDEYDEKFEVFEECYPKRVLNKIFKNYMTKLESLKLVTIGMLVYKSNELFKDDAEIIDETARQYEFIFIDEAQDLSPDLYQFVKYISKYSKLFLVGDGLQGIYGFKGGRSSYMLNANKEFKDMAVVNLPINYRCTEAIVRAANKVAERADESTDQNYVEAIANSKGGEKPIHYVAASESDCVVDLIKNYHKENEYDEIAVLARTNAVLIALKTKLFKNRIPSYLASKSNADIAEISLVLNYLKLATNHNDNEAFKAIINVPNRYISKKIVDDIALKSKGKSMFDVAVKMCKTTKSKWAYNLSDFVYIINTISKRKYQNAGEALKELLEMIDFHEYANNLSKDDAVRQEEIIGNINYLVEQASEYKNLKDFTEYIVPAITENDENGVQLMTVHKSKGLEYKNVIVAGFDEGLMPHKKSIDEQEEIHILYVAMTRAENKLALVSGCNPSCFAEFFGDTVEILNL